jgi:hypothetical protein
MKWKVGVTNAATGEGNELCTDGVLHGYLDPLLAVFLRPLHVDDNYLTLIEVDADEIVATDGLKVGSKLQTMVRVVEAPIITIAQRVEIARRCAEYAAEYAKYGAKSAKYGAKSAKYAKYATEYAEYAEYAAESAAKSAEYAESAAKSAEYAESAAKYAAKYATKSAESVRSTMFSDWLLKTIKEIIGDKNESSNV